MFTLFSDTQANARSLVADCGGTVARTWQEIILNLQLIGLFLDLPCVHLSYILQSLGKAVVLEGSDVLYTGKEVKT